MMQQKNGLHQAAFYKLFWGSPFQTRVAPTTPNHPSINKPTEPPQLNVPSRNRRCLSYDPLQLHTYLLTLVPPWYWGKSKLVGDIIKQRVQVKVGLGPVQ